MKVEWHAAAKFVGIILSANCSSAFLTSFLAAREQRLIDHDRAALSAISAATDLERYAAECSDIASEYDVPSNPRAGLARRLPSLPRWQVDTRWRNMPKEELDQMLSLPSKVNVAESYIRSARKYADAGDVAQATRDEAVLLGATAWRIAERLRKENGYPPLKLVQPFGTDLVRDAATLSANWQSGRGAGVDPR